VPDHQSGQARPDNDDDDVSVHGANAIDEDLGLRRSLQWLGREGDVDTGTTTSTPANLNSQASIIPVGPAPAITTFPGMQWCPQAARLSFY
jgi:hypothetical protein